MTVQRVQTATASSMLPYDRERMEDVGFMTCMTLVLLGNYAQTGHFGGPLAYTPFNVATHLAGPGNGGRLALVSALNPWRQSRRGSSSPAPGAPAACRPGIAGRRNPGSETGRWRARAGSAV